MKKYSGHLLYFLLLTGIATAQDTIIPLWNDVVPNRVQTNEQEEHVQEKILRISKVQYPEIEVYLPSKANNTGRGILIFPGGGYHILAYDWEGTDIAKWLNSQGIAAFVVKYRLPVSKSLLNPRLVPLLDAQRAIRLVRGLHKSWGLEADRIGIMGFSAGGHLAATLGTQFDRETYPPGDPFDSISARPDFMVLMYPVITFTKATTHRGSMEALLGKSPDSALMASFSAELQIKPTTPPTLLIHAADDTAVPPENSILFYEGLRKQGVPASLLIYARGGHGFSLALDDPYLRSWTAQVIAWLETLN
jgi:acetyl esterase/lipase